MIRTIQKIFFGFIACLFFSFQVIDKSLIGEWQGTDQGETGSFLFENDGFVTFTIGAETAGGREFENNGIICSMFYETNTLVKPHTIDLIVVQKDGGAELGRLPGIYEYMSSKKIKLQLSFDDKERPKTFNEKSGDVIILEKIN